MQNKELQITASQNKRRKKGKRKRNNVVSLATIGEKKGENIHNLHCKFCYLTNLKYRIRAIAITRTVITPPMSHLFRLILLDMFVMILLLLPMLSSTPFNCNTKVYILQFHMATSTVSSCFVTEIKEAKKRKTLRAKSRIKGPEHERNSQREIPCYQHAREIVAADADLGEVKLRALLFPASSSYYP